MRKFDGNAIVHFKKGELEEVIHFFKDVEATTAVLERMEVNAMTFMHFRRYSRAVVEQPTLREVKRGLFARIYTAEVWLNNELKDGQVKVFWNKIEADKPAQPTLIESESGL